MNIYRVIHRMGRKKKTKGSIVIIIIYWYWFIDKTILLIFVPDKKSWKKSKLNQSDQQTKGKIIEIRERKREEEGEKEKLPLRP